VSAVCGRQAAGGRWHWVPHLAFWLPHRISPVTHTTAGAASLSAGSSGLRASMRSRLTRPAEGAILLTGYRAYRELELTPSARNEPKAVHVDTVQFVEGMF
jgi:hypothetical protein